MSERALPTGRATLLFTDIESSTRLLELLGDAFADLVADHRAVLHGAIARHGGIDFGGDGDAHHAVFTDALSAVTAALEAQVALGERPWPHADRLRVRMGIHTGEVASARGEYYGMGLHGAARVSDAAHGGQIVISEDAAIEVRDALPDGATLDDLGPHVLKDLGKPVVLYQLVHTSLERSFPPLRTISAQSNNLPVELASFIGRDREVADVLALLESHRLVTLVGSGGTGKTRLSLHVAAQATSDFSDGVWFVDLVGADNHTTTTAVAAVIGAREEPGRELVDTVADRLRVKKVLLVLDNCEHVTDAASVLADALLARTSKLVVLASSREPLSVRGEAVYELSPLDVPSEEARTASEVLAFDAARLYAERGASARPGFVLSDDDAPFVAEVCRMLDGVPLAIEIAAARASVVTPKQLVERLRERLDLENDAARGRQRSLWALIDWSYELLDDREATLFRRLSIFPASFGLPSASDVCGDGADVLAVLSRLAWRSLVSVERHGVEARYRMFDMVRAYAERRAAEASETSDLHRRYTAHFVRLASELSDGLRSGDQRQALAAFGAEIPHVRHAIEGALAAGEPDVAGELVTATFPFWRMRGHFREGHDTAERVAGALPEGSPALGGMYLVIGTMRHWLGADGAPALERSIEVATTAGDERTLGSALLALGVAFETVDRIDEAEQLYVRAADIARTRSDVRDEAAVTGNLGIIELRRGRLDEAEVLLEKSRELAERSGEKHVAGNALANLAYIDAERYDYRRALERAQEAVALGRDLDAATLAVYLGNAAFAARELGATVTAVAYQEEALEIARRAGLMMAELTCLQNLAVFAADRGDLEGTLSWYGELRDLAASAGDVEKELTARLGIGHTLVDQTEYAAGEAALQDALTLARKIGSSRVADALAFLGVAALERGDVAVARTHADEASTLDESDHQAMRVKELLARVAEAEGENDLAEAAWSEMLAVTDRVGGGRSVKPLARLAALALRGGRSDEARGLCRRALACALGGGPPYELAYSLLDLAAPADELLGPGFGTRLTEAADALKAGDRSVIARLGEGLPFDVAADL